MVQHRKTNHTHDLQPEELEQTPAQVHGGHGVHDHTEHHRMMIRDFRTRFYVSLAVTVPVLVLSPFIQKIFGFTLIIPGASYIVFAFASFIYFYGGWPFLKGLADEFKDKAPGMMTLIAVAVTVAYAYSAAVTFGLAGSPFFWELATLIDIMLAGHWIEMRSVVGASNALQELVKLMPDTAHRKKGDGTEDVPLSEIKRNDVILIKPGEKIPSDGEVISGSSYVNESMLTGESKPVERGKGDRLIGGSLNGDGALTVLVQGTGEDSYLSRVITMVREAQAVKSRTQALSDKAAFWLTVIAITVGVTTLTAWLAVGRDLQFSIARMATVMVITCPHALGLAVPLVVAVSTSTSAQNGLLIRNRTAFENARKITSVIFDKTGTLTLGNFDVSDITAHAQGFDEKKVIAAAAALENSSEHPIGRGIVRKAKEMGISVPQAYNFNAVKGKGVEGTVEGRRMKVVSPGYLKEAGIYRPENVSAQAGETRVFLIVDGTLAGSIALADSIREESYTAIRRLQGNGVKCWMITGDNGAIAEAVSRELGMDGFFAEVLPDEKQEKVKELQKKGEYVAMTGDGVNDSPALAQANVGIAIGSGTDVAAATADIILVNSNPQDVTKLILFGRATYRKMVQNLIWATGYNFMAIPLAAGVLSGLGIILSPEVGALLMSLSTIIVAVNARLLKVGGINPDHAVSRGGEDQTKKKRGTDNG
ncbi:MAG TPA: cadmium-translocating P-type ATPase [Spirochaetia bacterium]|nr:cadmium-translocating P-type ATPase [Spirochaetia bacterium]